MNKASRYILFLLILQSPWKNKVISQAIDSNALKILSKAIDKLDAEKYGPYSIFFTYATGNDKIVAIREIDASYIKMIDNESTFYYFTDGSAKLDTKDSVFLFVNQPERKVSATRKLNDHQDGTYNIRNISIKEMLGRGNKFPDELTDTIRFYKNPATADADEYIIDVIEKKRVFNNGTIKSKLRYDRYWIDRKSMLPLKRQKYSHFVDDLEKEQIDIYEFTLSFPDRNPALSFPMNFFKDPKYRKTEEIPLPKIEEHEEVNLVGRMAPDFSALNLASGKVEKLSKYKGKVLLIDFWYLSCPPCRQLMPVLNEINEKYKNSEFLVLGVNVFDKDKDKIKKYLNEKKFMYSQLYLPQNAVERFHLTAFPTTVLIDKSGKVKVVETGYWDEFKESMTKLIDAELKK